jgi:hypothetical protein
LLRAIKVNPEVVAAASADMDDSAYWIQLAGNERLPLILGQG